MRERKRVGKSWKEMGGVSADREGEICSRNGKPRYTLLIIKGLRG